jgi:hypothetical protein
MNNNQSRITTNETNVQAGKMPKENNHQLDATQKRALELYYMQVTKLPRRKAKTELSNKYGIDPLALNKWFQSRRNKDPDYLSQRKSKSIIIKKNRL